MNDREWAARWVGWEYTDGNAYAPDRGGAFDMSNTDADLAEAVRVKCRSMTPKISPILAVGIIGKWYQHGPLAFIAAVREVVGE